MDLGRHFESNQRKLALITDLDSQWAVALAKCREHVRIRLKSRVTFGAHTSTRLGEDPLDYYVSYSYEAILSGNWEWKDAYTLSEQIIRIADSTISTEVEKYNTKKARTDQVKISSADPNDIFYQQLFIENEQDYVREVVINKQIEVIENAVSNDNDLEFFWECIKDGLKPKEISEIMGKTPKQVNKLREKLIKKIRTSQHFEME